MDVDSAAAGGSPLLAGKSSSRLSGSPCWIQGDKAPLQLYFRSVADSPLNGSTAMELAAGSAIVIEGKLVADLGKADSEALFSASAFTASGAGDDLYYGAVLDLNGPKITTAFATSKNVPLTVRVDVDVQDAGNTTRLKFQFEITLKKKVYEGDPLALPVDHPTTTPTRRTPGSFRSTRIWPGTRLSICPMARPAIISTARRTTLGIRSWLSW